MGRALLEKFTPARSILELAEKYSQHPLIEIIQRGPDSRLAQTDVLQPALVAIELGYFELLRESGCTPSAIAGHSLGEIAALYAAGVIGKHDALRLGAERGRLMNQTAEGGMVAIKDIAPERIEELLSETSCSSVVIANYNAPSQTVVSGSINGLDALIPRISRAGGSCVRLNVSGAWHSPLVGQAAVGFATVLDTVEFSAPHSVLVLGVTGLQHSDPIDIRNVMKRQIVSPVRWSSVLQRLIELGADRFLEVGPGKVLRGLLRKNLPAASTYSVSGVDSSKTVSELLALLPQAETQAS